MSILQHYISQLACHDATMHVGVHMSTAHVVTCHLVCSAYVDLPVLIWSAFSARVLAMNSSLDLLCSGVFRIPPQCEADRMLLPASLLSPLPKIGAIRTILDISVVSRSVVSCRVVSCLCVWVCCCVKGFVCSCLWLTVCGYAFVSVCMGVVMNV